MSPELMWVVGLSVTVALALVSAIIAAFRTLAGRVQSGDQKLSDRIDKIKDDYVRRDDLRDHIDRIEQNLQNVRADMQENTNRVLDAISKSKSDG